MKKLIYILILTSFGANAQSISNQVISSYGLSASNGTTQTDVTIGEPVIATVSDGNNTLTQGFHQTKLMITTINENEKTNNYQFYPNPVNEVLNFNFTNSNNEPVGLQLFDINGKILYNKQNITTNEQLSFSDRANGQYILKVIDKNNKEIKTVKIIKN
ncbi:MAG: T9SS type A sorting domain-containing protein [Flavobacteriales bacterium]|nr:T9SS type A sorting domain-containing protein [Flavobacteriales bacterium]